MKNTIILISAILSLVLLTDCNREEPPAECIISECNPWSYSIVEKGTDCNLMGRNGEPIHPDSIRVTYQTGEGIPHRLEFFGDWPRFSFLYQDALRRCDLFNTDSTFNMRFYIYLGNNDTDTLDIQIAPCRDFDQMAYNGSTENWFNVGTATNNVCGRIPTLSLGSFLLRKNISQP